MESTRRFSDPVSDYVRYRPGYPEALLATMRERPSTAWTGMDLRTVPPAFDVRESLEVGVGTRRWGASALRRHRSPARRMGRSSP